MSDAKERFAWEQEVRAAGLGLRDTAVGLSVATYFPNIRPGVKRLADGLGVSERSVERALASLLAKGYLRQLAAANRWKGHAAVYALSVPIDPTPVSGGEVDPTPESTRHLSRVDTDERSIDPTPESESTRHQCRPKREGQETTTTSTSTYLDPWADLDGQPEVAPTEVAVAVEVAPPSFDDDDDAEDKSSNETWADVERKVAERDGQSAQPYVSHYLRR